MHVSPDGSYGSFVGIDSDESIGNVESLSSLAEEDMISSEFDIELGLCESYIVVSELTISFVEDIASFGSSNEFETYSFVMELLS